jgi:hypothetical protein
MNTNFFKTGACKIVYKEKFIGVTQDNPVLNIEPEFYEAQCDQNGVSKIIMSMKISVFMEIKEIDTNFVKEIPASTGGVLTLLPVSDENNISYCFPRAVFIPNTKDSCHKINFEVYEDSEGVLIKKF